MTTSPSTSAESDLQRTAVIDAIRKCAAAARSERLHPVRVRNAIECGRALVQLKELLRHGDFDRALAEECGLSRATAHRYMCLSTHTERLTPLMTIREAYLAVGVIKPKEPGKTSRGPECGTVHGINSQG